MSNGIKRYFLMRQPTHTLSLLPYSTNNPNKITDHKGKIDRLPAPFVLKR
ncbi:MAG: hypothetical protein PUK66_06680 [Bacteroidales bacterium]|nr:hypothetical protein [Porphyromonas sp.]MDD7438494.1 hypothetical protein [Bacteroidales bacterium]MDY3067077.1 hypothetical protein [Porphyromonas sp.]